VLTNLFPGSRQSPQALHRWLLCPCYSATKLSRPDSKHDD
jgi:hypothetical protein